MILPQRIFTAWASGRRSASSLSDTFISAFVDGFWYQADKDVLCGLQRPPAEALRPRSWILSVQEVLGSLKVTKWFLKLLPCLSASLAKKKGKEKVLHCVSKNLSCLSSDSAHFACMVMESLCNKLLAHVTCFLVSCPSKHTETNLKKICFKSFKANCSFMLCALGNSLCKAGLQILLLSQFGILGSPFPSLSLGFLLPHRLVIIESTVCRDNAACTH